MIYPYTVISYEQLHLVYNLLKSFGYSLSCFWDNDEEGAFKILCSVCKNRNSIVVVINDMDIFGKFHFYLSDNHLNQNLQRIYIQDLYEFLRLAAEYKGCSEY